MLGLRYAHLIKYLVHNLIFAGAYFCLAFLSITYFSWEESNSCPVWPASGLALGVLLLSGPRLIPGIFLGALSANFLSFPADPSFSLLAYLLACGGIAVGNTLEAAGGAWALRRWTRLKEHQYTQEFFLFQAVAAGACLLAALNGPLWMIAVDQLSWADYGYASLIWWIGDLSGILLFGPLVWVAWKYPYLGKAIVQKIEALCFLMALTVVSYATLQHSSFPYPLAFLPICVLTCSPFRYPLFVTCLGIGIVSANAVFGVIWENGPFSHMGISHTAEFILLEIFLFSVFVSIHSLSVVYQERYLLLTRLNLEVERKTTALQESKRQAEDAEQAMRQERDYYKSCLPHIESIRSLVAGMQGLRDVEEAQGILNNLIQHIKEDEEP